MITHSDKFSEHSWVETDGINAEVVNKWSKNVVFDGVTVKDKVKDFVPVCSNSSKTVICKNRRIDLGLLLLKVFVVGAWQYKFSELIVTGQEFKHNLLILFSIAT